MAHFSEDTSLNKIDTAGQAALSQLTGKKTPLNQMGFNVGKFKLVGAQVADSLFQ